MRQILGRAHDSREFVNDICYVPGFGIIFAFVSKNASSLLKSLLATEGNLAGSGRRLKNPHFRANTGFLGVDDVGVDQMDAWITDPTVPKVVVGRDPVARLVSAWRSRVDTWALAPYQTERELQDWLELRQRILGHSQGAHASSTEEALTSDITFQMLVDYVEQMPSWLLDRHLVPQAYACGADVINYDLVGQVENLDAFLTGLERLTGKELPPADLAFANVSPEKSRRTIEVTEAQRRSVRKRFQDDYVLFGYDRGER